MAACLPFIHAEVDIVRPACIIALGSTAAEGLLGLTSTIEAMRGSWQAFDGIPVRVTYHPGHLLKSTADLAIRRQVWEDMLMVMEEVILPISAKQRGFFLAKS
jgi:DNA polymerase